jgi:hypothetical protein
VRFAVAIPYLQTNLRQFLQKHRANPALKADVLCTTAKGRKAELLHVGCLDKEPKVRVLLTVRHHACEMVSGYEPTEGVCGPATKPPHRSGRSRPHLFGARRRRLPRSRV